MDYRQLGNSALQISRLSFGCMSLKKGVKENERILHRAVELGINFFDTADLYDKGENEELVGRALKEKRSEILLATKVGNQWKADGSGWDWNPRKSYILESVEASLQRLGTEYIDLYQLHGGTIDDPIDETIDAFEQLVREGKIRYYGISSIRPNVIREWVARSNIISVMMQYSLLDRRPEESCLSLLQEKNIGVLVRGSLAQGLLAGKAPREYLEYSETDVKKLITAIQEMSTGTKDNLHIAQQFVLSHPAVTSLVAGIRTMEQLEASLSSYHLTDIPEQEMKPLTEILPPLKYTAHR
jgi:aryl-alcohol dehydrogenase-like predicted oxidoreductase